MGPGPRCVDQRGVYTLVITRVWTGADDIPPASSQVREARSRDTGGSLVRTSTAPRERAQLYLAGGLSRSTTSVLLSPLNTCTDLPVFTGFMYYNSGVPPSY